MIGRSESTRQPLTFVRLVRSERSGPSAAVRLLPRKLPRVQSAKVNRAVEHLDGAIAETSSADQLLPLELLRYELLRSAEMPGALDAAARIAAIAIPESQGSARAYEIQLAALEQSTTEGFAPEAQAALDQAIRHCPAAALPSFLLLKGRLLLKAASTREDLIRASWPFMRVAIHFPDDPRAAEGLVGAAQVLGRLGNRRKAFELLDECLQHAHLQEETRLAAEEARQRLHEARTD